MLRIRKIPRQILWTQLLVTGIWYLINVMAWVRNPNSSGEFAIPLIVRGTESIAMLLVSGALICFLEYWPSYIHKAIPRLLLLLTLYPAAILADFVSLGIRALLGYSPPQITSSLFIHSLYYYIPMLLIMVAYAYMKNQLEVSRERERAYQAETLAEQARWMMLRYQVNPHFLFNALNTIRALIGSDNENARRIVTELSEYFRYSLARDKEALVSVKDELEAVKSYLEIQLIRFKDKLEVKMEEDPEAMACAVPVFAVQTLVENGIKYGMLSSDGPVSLQIISKLEKGKLDISVINSGSFLKDGARPLKGESTGTGLENLKARLKHLDSGFHFDLLEEKGQVVARLVLTAKYLDNGLLEGINR